MPIATVAMRNILANAYAAAATHAALFTGDPGTAGNNTNEVTGGSPAYARKALSWSSASASAVTVTPAAFDVPAGTTVTYAGVCSSSSGNTVLDKGPVTSQNFASQGTYTLTLTYTQS